MKQRTVLDAAAFDVLDTPKGRGLPGLIQQTLARDGEICCAAVTLAEVCRGTARTRRVEAALTRKRGGQRIRVVPTDERLAKLVGTVLYKTDSGSERLGDAHVVAVCAGADAAVVMTSDFDDIVALATAVSGTRIVVRDPTAN
ncbi:MAG: type II toxin-antitoxin system VapC family toxin [Egibacteraceae bacterium]